MTTARLRVLGLLAALLAAPVAAKADLMTGCQPEISRFCGDVSEGRGRISACLAGRYEQLGAACKPEVRSVMGSRLVPSDLRAIFQPGFSTPVPASCAAAARSFCPGVTAPGRVFSCLYAHSDQVGGTCSADAQAAVR